MPIDTFDEDSPFNHFLNRSGCDYNSDDGLDDEDYEDDDRPSGRSLGAKLPFGPTTKKQTAPYGRGRAAWETLRAVLNSGIVLFLLIFVIVFTVLYFSVDGIQTVNELQNTVATQQTRIIQMQGTLAALFSPGDKRTI